MFLDVHTDDGSFDPRAPHQGLDRGFVAVKRMLMTVFGQKPEAREVPEPVVDQRNHLAGVLDGPRSMMVCRRVNRMPRYNTAWRRWNFAGIATEAADPTGHDSEIALEYR